MPTENTIELEHANALDCYARWEPPTVIISDGAYGVGGFDGDPRSLDLLVDWYRPHVAAWTRHATIQTTLWFWGTELSWATVHPLLQASGWLYKAANIWNKGLAFAAGNTNTKTLTHLPIVTEICVQYTLGVAWIRQDGQPFVMQNWLRSEWQRTGLPMKKANDACGVKSAAARKYLGSDYQWYCPPTETFLLLKQYADQHGDPAGRPYFVIPGCTDDTDQLGSQWVKLRAKFHCPLGVTNVWDEPALRSQERVKVNGKALHANQKPLRLIERIIQLSSDTGNVVWEPFGGLFTGAIASQRLQRSYFGSEIDQKIYQAGTNRYLQETRDGK